VVKFPHSFVGKFPRSTQWLDSALYCRTQVRVLMWGKSVRSTDRQGEHIYYSEHVSTLSFGARDRAPIFGKCPRSIVR
jgi:hypothetical protein